MRPARCLERGALAIKPNGEPFTENGIGMASRPFTVVFCYRSTNNPMEGLMATLRSLCWRFGPDWPGRRCLAKTRRGTPCQKPALKGNARCQLHGGKRGAPSGTRNSNFKTGKFTKERIALRREQAAQLRELERLGRELGMFED